MTALENALRFAKKGWKLFPCQWRDGHHAPYVKWGEGSSSDPVVIRRWETDYRGCYYCVATQQSDITVVDVDIKNGKRGDESLTQLEGHYSDLPVTLKSGTPSGGYHYFFRGASGVTVDQLGEGLDTPGMVPLPRSNVPGKGQYELLQNGAVAEVPPWVKQLAGAVSERDPRAQEPIGPEDAPEDVARAIQYAKDAPPSLQGEGGDLNMMRVARKLRDYGMSEEKTVEIIHDHFYKRCDPNDGGQHGDFVERKVRNAYEYAKGRQGDKSLSVLREKRPTAEDMFDVEEVVPFVSEEEAASIVEFLGEEEGLKYIAERTADAKAKISNAADAKARAAEVKELSRTRKAKKDSLSPNLELSRFPNDSLPLPPLPKWIFGKRYLAGEVTCLFAPPGVGKSLFVLLEGISLATGLKLTESVPKVPGAVMLYSAEDPEDELRRRLLAASKRNGLTSADYKYPIYYETPQRGDTSQYLVHYVDRVAVPNELVIQKIITNIKHYGIRLFIADPLAKCHGVNENDNPEMNLLLAVFSRIAEEGDCAVSLVHHTTKGKHKPGDMDSGRGASAISGAARIIDTLRTFRKEDAKIYSVPPRDWWKYVCIDIAKTSRTGKEGSIPWYKISSEFLGLPPAPGYPDVDDYGVGSLALEELDEVEEVVEEAEVVASPNKISDNAIINKVTDVVMESEGQEETLHALTRACMADLGGAETTLKRRVIKLFKEPGCGAGDGKLLYVIHKGVKVIRYDSYVLSNNPEAVK